MKSGVYAILHVATGRHYVGSSRDVQARFSAHRSLLRAGTHHSPHLQRAWLKYGEDEFAFCVIETVVCVDDLLRVEQIWIDRLRAAEPTRGFNTAEVAGTRVGVPQSDAARRKMSTAGRGKPKSMEHRAAIGAGNRGKVRTEECKRRLSAAIIPIVRTPERLALSIEGGRKTGGWNKGTTASSEAKAKMSYAAKARVARSQRGGDGRFVSRNVTEGSL